MEGLIDLSGRVAVITGGGTGLGLACARHFLAEGCRVVALGRDREADFDDPRFTFLDLDVTDDDAIARLAARLPGVDVLVNAAGIILHDMEEFSPAGFRKVIDVNLGGAQAVTMGLRGQRRLHVVVLRLGPQSGLCGEQGRHRAADALVRGRVRA
jgi:NAD(P)-dependent dehydrogenase (short-subunit alcohol dehydrogenase family)